MQVQNLLKSVRQEAANFWIVCTAVYSAEGGLTTGFCGMAMLENQQKEATALLQNIDGYRGRVKNCGIVYNKREMNESN